MTEKHYGQTVRKTEGIVTVDRANQVHEPSVRHPRVFENLRAGKHPLWNVGDVAAYLGVSGRTVRDWVYRQVIPYRKAGNSVRFAPDEIERWTLPKKE